MRPCFINGVISSGTPWIIDEVTELNLQEEVRTNYSAGLYPAGIRSGTKDSCPTEKAYRETKMERMRGKNRPCNPTFIFIFSMCVWTLISLVCHAAHINHTKLWICHARRINDPFVSVKFNSQSPQRSSLYAIIVKYCYCLIFELIFFFEMSINIFFLN